MKKILALITFFFLCYGCATVPTESLQSLEQRVTQLEKAKSVSGKNIMLLAEQAGARKFWWRNALEGAPDGLDAVTGMVDGDMAIVGTLVTTNATGYMYIYDENGTNTTSSPTRIKGSTGGAWQLVNFNAQLVTSNAADGLHYIDVSNSSDFAGTPAHGYCFYRISDSKWCCYNGSVWVCISM